MKILFTCGGTAGHINPAIGIADKLKERYGGEFEALFIGARGMMETELVPRAGYEIRTVTITNLRRSLKPNAIAHNFATMRNVFSATKESKEILKQFQPDAVVGTGGYVCYPVLKAAHGLGIPTLVHESNVQPGLTTKMLAGSVDCVMLGFEEAAHFYRAGVRTVYTGTPVRTDFLHPGSFRTYGSPEMRFDKATVLSVWGSLGSDHMNSIMPEFIRYVAEEERFYLIHSAGKRGFAPLMKKLRDERIDCSSRGVDVREYIFDMPTVMAQSELVMCRSGASTLSELTALGKPSILIPSPNVTNNHQEKNARLLEEKGAAVVLIEGKFTAKSLYESVCKLLEQPKKLDAMSDAAMKAGKPDADDIIADLVTEYAKKNK